MRPVGIVAAHAARRSRSLLVALVVLGVSYVATYVLVRRSLQENAL